MGVAPFARHQASPESTGVRKAALSVRLASAVAVSWLVVGFLGVILAWYWWVARGG